MLCTFVCRCDHAALYMSQTRTHTHTHLHMHMHAYMYACVFFWACKRYCASYLVLLSYITNKNKKLSHLYTGRFTYLPKQTHTHTHTHTHTQVQREQIMLPPSPPSLSSPLPPPLPCQLPTSRGLKTPFSCNMPPGRSSAQTQEEEEEEEEEGRGGGRGEGKGWGVKGQRRRRGGGERRGVGGEGAAFNDTIGGPRAPHTHTHTHTHTHSTCTCRPVCGLHLNSTPRPAARSRNNTLCVYTLHIIY